jgi:hypothetical protein
MKRELNAAFAPCWNYITCRIVDEKGMKKGDKMGERSAALPIEGTRRPRSSHPPPRAFQTTTPTCTQSSLRAQCAPSAASRSSTPRWRGGTARSRAHGRTLRFFLRGWLHLWFRGPQRHFPGRAAVYDCGCGSVARGAPRGCDDLVD